MTRSFSVILARALASASRGEVCASTMRSLPADTPLAQQAALTLIQPEQDEVIDPAQVYAWSQALPRAHELLKVAECGHFFHGKLVELKELVLPRL